MHVQGKTLYVSGTQINPNNPTGITGTLGDIADDIFRVPTNTLAGTARYRAITRILHDNPNITRLSGHSLGAATAHQWISDHKGWKGSAMLYNSPEISWTHSDPRVRSARHYLDPISVLDRAASDSWPGLNPHAYR